MSDQTNDRGHRLEELYEACMKLPAGERDAYIRKNTGDDPAMASQLLKMIPLVMATASLSANPNTAQAHSYTAESPTGGHDVFEFERDAVFGNCQVLSGYGGGAMGDVYLALDLENHRRQVALKVMKPRLIGKEDQQRFHNETFALSLLVHPNIAQLYFWGIQPWNGIDRPYLVMEFIDGSTLEKYLTDNVLSQRQILHLLRKICLAVHHGHLKGVYHRDLKPSNILMTTEGEPKIVDFGVSFTLSPNAAADKETTLNENVGTATYMAPEVARGQPYKLEPASDVYSLGIIAFEAFAKRRPGVELDSGDLELLEYPLTSRHILARVSTCERERLRGVDRKFSRDLEDVIAKALRLKISERYTDAAEFAEDLRRVASFEPIKQREHSRIYQAAMFTRRNPLLVAAAAGLLISISTAAVIFRIDEVHSRQARDQAVLDFENETKVRKLAVGRGDKIEQQNAAAHFRAAQLADQRGDWAVSAVEYRSAQDAGYSDRLNLAVGQLRALDRLNQTDDANALIDRVEKSSPDIFQSPEFQIAVGFFNWSTKPEQSFAMINSALQSGDQLAPADRAFGQALTTDNFGFAAAKLRETVEYDTFNYDALALLAVCDLALGDAHQCELDAGILRKLYPRVDTGAVLAAFGCAFAGRRDAAVASLQSATSLSPAMKSSLVQTIGFIDRYRSMDDIHLLSKFEIASEAMSVVPVVTSLAERSGLGSLRFPILFSKFLRSFSHEQLVGYILNPQKFREIVAGWPNGNGELMAGQLDLEDDHGASGRTHLAHATTAPALIDCRRHAASLLAGLNAAANLRQKNPDAAAIAEKDLNQVIALGGVRPDVFSEEIFAVRAGATFNLYPQVQTLALMWLVHVPNDHIAMYYLALADFNLNQPVAAKAFFQAAVDTGLHDQVLGKDAKLKIQLLSSPATTQPTTNSR